MHIKLDCSCWQNYIMSRWKECNRGHMFGIQHSICSCASWHITTRSYLQFGYKRNCTIFELDAIPLNSLYSASWDSLFSIVCIHIFAQITKHGFCIIDVILWYSFNIMLGKEQGRKTNVILLSKKIYETHKRLPKIHSLYRLKVPILPAVMQML